VVLGFVSLQMFFKNKKIPENIGVREGKLAPVPSSPNAVSSQTDVREKHVAPLPFKGGLKISKAALKAVLEQYGGVEIISESDHYIHAVSTTRWMKFKDDLEFYFDSDEEKIHFRSASRVGYSDLGLNRKRYQRLRELYMYHL
jgi:uncharacterized protein (DUF1499 family)